MLRPLPARRRPTLRALAASTALAAVFALLASTSPRAPASTLADVLQTGAVGGTAIEYGPMGSPADVAHLGSASLVIAGSQAMADFTPLTPIQEDRERRAAQLIHDSGAKAIRYVNTYWLPIPGTYEEIELGAHRDWAFCRTAGTPLLGRTTPDGRSWYFVDANERAARAAFVAFFTKVKGWGYDGVFVDRGAAALQGGKDAAGVPVWFASSACTQDPIHPGRRFADAFVDLMGEAKTLGLKVVLNYGVSPFHALYPMRPDPSDPDCQARRYAQCSTLTDVWPKVDFVVDETPAATDAAGFLREWTENRAGETDPRWPRRVIGLVKDSTSRDSAYFKWSAARLANLQVTINTGEDLCVTAPCFRTGRYPELTTVRLGRAYGTESSRVQCDTGSNVACLHIRRYERGAVLVNTAATARTIQALSIGTAGCRTVRDIHASGALLGGGACVTVFDYTVPARSGRVLVYDVPRACRGHRATIVGSNGGETITGTDTADVILGRGGDDVIDGKGGNDVICADDLNTSALPGNDLVIGGAGVDLCMPGSGNDVGAECENVPTSGVFGLDGRTLVRLAASSPAPGEQEHVGLTLDASGRVVGAASGGPGRQTEAFRLDTNGRLDATFASTGQARVSLGTASWATGAGVDSQGRIILAGAASGIADTAAHSVVRRFTGADADDTTFGTAGAVNLALGESDGVRDLEVLGDDSILAVATVRNPELLTVFKLTPAGALDPAFGGGDGIFSTSSAAGRGLAVTADRIVIAGAVSGPATDEIRGLVIRLLPDGTTDATFGSAGLVALQAAVSGGRTILDDVTVDADGRIVVVGRVASTAGDRSTILVARLLGDGTLDIGFGTGGLVVTDVTGREIERASDVAVDASGNVYVAATAGPSWVLLKYLADGSPDSSYGLDGAAVGLAHSAFAELRAPRLLLSADGSALLAGTTDRGVLVARVRPNGLTFG